MDEDAVVSALAKRFIARRDVKAAQKSTGEYRPVVADPKVPDSYLPWKVGDLRAHIRGEKSYGHYLLSKENTCKLFAFDLDVRKEAREYFYPSAEGVENPERTDELIRQLRTVAEGLAARTERLAGVETAIAFSGGKGLHMYAFTGEIPAAEAKSAATLVLEDFGCFEAFRGTNFWRYRGDPNFFPDVEIEIFPKQTELGADGLGNLMRLPLGVNRKTGWKAFFLDYDSDLDELVPLDPMKALGLEVAAA